MAPAKEMQMEMGDSFASVLTIVDDHPETLFLVTLLTGNLSDLEHQVAQEFLITGFGKRDPGDGFLGNEKEVDRSLRCNVAEAETEIIFVNDIGRNFPGDDFLEESGFVAHDSRVSWSRRWGTEILWS